MEGAPRDKVFDGRGLVAGARIVNVHVEVEHFLPHGDEKTKLALLPGVFLRDLQFNRFVGVAKAGEQRGRRLSHLEIDWAILDLNDDVIVEVAVKRMKVVVGGLGAIVLQVSPVEMVVVNERAVEHDATVGLERSRNHVGSVGRSAAISGRAEASLGISFHHEAAEIRDLPVNSVDLFAPPVRDLWIERIKCVEAADGFRAAQIDRQGKLDAPWTECIGDAADLRDEVVVKNSRISIDVVHGASVDPDGSQQTSVLAGASQVVADFSIGEEERGAPVSAFDATVEVVPLVHPANGSIGLLDLIDRGDALRASDFAQQREHTVEDPAVSGAGDDDAVESVNRRAL